jgi:hypothetical protein
MRVYAKCIVGQVESWTCHGSGPAGSWGFVRVDLAVVIEVVVNAAVNEGSAPGAVPAAGARPPARGPCLDSGSAVGEVGQLSALPQHRTVGGHPPNRLVADPVPGMVRLDMCGGLAVGVVEQLLATELEEHDLEDVL